MAICFVGVEFVSRSKGKNAVCKSAYNMRGMLKFEGTEFRNPEIFNFSRNPPIVSHKILLPIGVDERFKNPEYLWNHVEKFENRLNSQIQIEFVLALPDDPEISDDMRIELAHRFMEKHFVSHGFGVQIDIHKSDTLLRMKLEDHTKFIHHNHHAHCLITTRRFDESGKTFESHKPRQFFPQVRKGKVVDAEKWHRIWIQEQNDYFRSKGLDLTVDLPGTVTQSHLGPIRMRGKNQSLLEENELRKELNTLESVDAKQILKLVSSYHSSFSQKTVEFYIQKHVPFKLQNQVREEFWKLGDIVELYQIKGGASPSFAAYSTHSVIDEERKIFRIANRLIRKERLIIERQESVMSLSQKLNKEQKQAFKEAVFGKNIVCIDGEAGTGKSTLLVALQKAHAIQGYTVRGLGPDNATVGVLKEKGFDRSENIHSFLFHYRNGKRSIEKGSEVWIIDESSKISNPSFLELMKIAEKNRVKLIFCGDVLQLSPIERGEMFHSFCKEFGCSRLVDIQRQKSQIQRTIAKAWASGRVSDAVNLLVREKALHFSDDKMGAVKSLLRHWAFDRSNHPQSSLVIAQKKDEISVLNDVIHLYRKMNKELGEKEFFCSTSEGLITISEGDVIEFRKNNKELGIYNGDCGVLTKASNDKFIVSINRKEARHEIEFNPKEYSHFSLGYATTAYRSQGRTVDRAYLLHSPQMRQDDFYVVFTRHIREVKCFVSQTECKNIATFKRLASRGKERDSTLSYHTKDEILSQKKLEKLIHSESILERAQGILRKKWSELDLLKRFTDRKPNERFFHPEIPKYPPGSVIEVEPGFSLNRDIIRSRFVPDFQGKGEFKIVSSKETLNSADIVNDVFVNPSLNESNKEGNFLDGVSVNHLAEELYKDYGRYVVRSDGKDFQNEFSNQNQSYGFMSIEKQKELKEYLIRVDEARSLFSICKEEAKVKSIPIRSTSLSSDWLSAVRLRNESAFFLGLSRNDARRCLGEKRGNILFEQAEQHRKLISVKEKNSSFKIEEELKLNAEALCAVLFPEGPSIKTGSTLRFRNKGSLAVNVEGTYQGTFKDFEFDTKGGMLSLIRQEKGYSFSESLSFAKDFLGKIEEIKIPSQYRLPNEKEHDWVSLAPPKDQLDPDLSVISKSIAKNYNETARYTYRDDEGNVLFYTVRMEKKSGGSKQVLPLSYGFDPNHPKWERWAIKGFISDFKPLYGLEKVYSRKDKPILIVEGEKAVDSAQVIFPDYNVISWLGGANSASKADWKHLLGKDIVIWPDNDQAGYRAADAISSELRRIGVNSLRVVDRKSLINHFPTKWDLADSLPTNISEKFLKDLILRSKEQAVSLASLERSLQNAKGDLDLNLAKEILWRVEDRLRSEKHDCNPWELKQNILKETLLILQNKDSIEIELNKAGIHNDFNERMTNQYIYFKARTGKDPSFIELDSIKSILKEYGRLLPNYGLTQDSSSNTKLVSLTYAFDNVISEAFYKNYSSINKNSLLTESIKNEMIKYNYLTNQRSNDFSVSEEIRSRREMQREI